MRKFAACLVVVALAGTSAFAGTVTFTPDVALPIMNPGDPLNFNVSVAVDPQQDPPWTGIESVDMILGTDDPLSMDPMHWTYSGDATTAFGPFIGTPEQEDLGLYADGIKGIGGFAFMGAVASPFNLGDLAIDTSVAGTYTIMVDGFDVDDGRSNIALGAETDPLKGSITFTVLPEPATMLLLGLGAVGLLRRRK